MQNFVNYIYLPNNKINKQENFFQHSLLIGGRGCILVDFFKV